LGKGVFWTILEIKVSKDLVSEKAVHCNRSPGVEPVGAPREEYFMCLGANPYLARKASMRQFG
jgi:hypothetical protein